VFVAKRTGAQALVELIENLLNKCRWAWWFQFPSGAAGLVAAAGARRTTPRWPRWGPRLGRPQHYLPARGHVIPDGRFHSRPRYRWSHGHHRCRNRVFALFPSKVRTETVVS
jgi:hypothetical protein